MKVEVVRRGVNDLVLRFADEDSSEADGKKSPLVLLAETIAVLEADV